MTTRKITRRGCLKSAAAVGAAFHLVPRHVLGGAGRVPPSEQVNLAGIGVGGIGFSQLASCEQAGFRIAALCDVDDVYAKTAYDRWPMARRYRDFRELLEAEGDRIDAVYCGTPDHTHAVIVLAALRRKKHVCSVKPLTRTIEELDIVVAAARKAGVATQVTVIPNTSESACRTCEQIWAGAVGAVREVHIWSNRPIWPQGMPRPPGEDPVPATFDWELWLGPAPFRPFKSEWASDDLALRQIAGIRDKTPHSTAVYHPWNFRGWWDFGTGALGDMGCHHLNTPYRALRLEHPVAVEATTTRRFEESAPLASIVTFEYAARGDMPPVRVIWYDGGLKPPRPSALNKPLADEGVLYVGDEGMMFSPALLSPERAAKFAGTPRTLPRRGGTWVEWMEAIRGGEKAGCHFDWAALLTEAVLLGNIAIRTGRRIEWNAAARRIINDESANLLLGASYRDGWTLQP